MDEAYVRQLHVRVDYYRANPDWCADKLHQLLNLADEYDGEDAADMYDVGQQAAAAEIRQILATTSRYDDIEGPGAVRIEDLVERSSLGTPEARALRESVSDEDAREAVRRAAEMRTEPLMMCISCGHPDIVDAVTATNELCRHCTRCGYLWHEAMRTEPEHG